jgi:SSS family solute:Na+ symporter
MIRRSLIISLASLALLGAGPTGACGADQTLKDDVRLRCYDVLTRALEDASPWIRVHAAEALIALKRTQPALAVFRPRSETTEPRYRIVVWRVLAAAEPEPAQRRRYVERIRAALLDPNGPDQTHAMEALAKLHEPIADEAERRRVLDVADGRGDAAPFAVWRLAQAKDATAVNRLVKLLHADDATTRARAAYVLGRLKPLPKAASDAISTALKTEPIDSPARVMLRAAQGEDAVRELARDAQVAPSGRYFAAMSLAECGTTQDYAILAQLLNDPDADVRVGAAYAMLQIDGRGAARPD